MIAIFSFLGIPFKNKGRDFSGVDCYGLVYLFYKYDRGTELKKYDECYQNCNNKKEADNALMNNKSSWKRTEKPDYGDVILFQKNGLCSHVGIYIDKNKFMHVVRNSTVHISNIKDYEKAIEGYYEYIQN